MKNLKIIFTYILSLPRQFWVGLSGFMAAVMLLYYPIGMLIVHKVDDDLSFMANTAPNPRESKAVAVIASLVDREVSQNSWTPNDPFFLPGAMLDRMPSFQRGIIAASSRFTLELRDEIARTRGSSQADNDLESAASLLSYSPNVWLFNFDVSIFPTTSSDKQYRSAVKALQNYNKRLTEGTAIFETRADNLQQALDRIALDIGSSSASIDNYISTRSSEFINTDADELYYNVKGRMYAYYLILRELEKDFAVVIKEKDASNAWAQMLSSFAEAASISHFFVFNGDPHGSIVPNHLATQGFYLMRARTQLREITNILQK